jgi:ribosomal protein S18 acetylase RimI-like enzyme
VDIKIVRLQQNHCEKAASVLADAFLEDPDVSAIIRSDPQKRRLILLAHYRNLVNLFLPMGRSQCALAGDDIVGVMLFTAPGEEPLTTFTLLKFVCKMFLHLNPAAICRALKSSIDDENHRPRRLHYYLSTLGVDPLHQGQGIGKTLLSHVIALADQEERLIYLSSTNPKAIPLYEKFGFETISVTSPLGTASHHMERKPKVLQEKS